MTEAECADPTCRNVGRYSSKQAGLCPEHWTQNVACHVADPAGDHENSNDYHFYLDGEMVTE